MPVENCFIADAAVINDGRDIDDPFVGLGSVLIFLQLQLDFCKLSRKI